MSRADGEHRLSACSVPCAANPEVLREGLPQEHAYDLVYRHALDVDASGERLVMGSTTGSLWISEGAGDHWCALTTHLPPIYQVCFASS